MPYSNHVSNNMNYEAAIEAIIKESKETGKTVGIEIAQGISSTDALLGKVAEKAIDIAQDKLSDVSEPEI